MSQPDTPTGPSIDTRELAAFRKFVTEVSDHEDTADLHAKAQDAADKIARLEDAVADAEAAITDLRSEVEAVNTNQQGPQTRAAKYGAMVDHAENQPKSPHQDGVALGYKDVMTATACSQAHAYTLMEELAHEFPWATFTTDGEGNKAVVVTIPDGDAGGWDRYRRHIQTVRGE